MFDCPAYRYLDGVLEEAVIMSDISLDELKAVSSQVSLAERNVASFVAGGPFLNMLFWGEKGSGKSTLLRLLTIKYKNAGLITIEVLDDRTGGIYALYKMIRACNDKKFILYFDDISFNENDGSYRRFKSAVEGGLEEKPKNVLFAATSNKRHLVSDKGGDTGDIYDRDETNERTSLQARFGLSIGFYQLNKDDYLKICAMYLDKYGVKAETGWEKAAEAYAIDRGGRSGRLAKQFAAFLAITR